MTKEDQKIQIKQSERGLMRTIVIIIIAILVVSYFDINMKDLVQSETTKNNFSFVGDLLSRAWEVIKPVWDSIWEMLGPVVKDQIKEQL